VDIQSDAEFAQAEAEAAFAGGDSGEEFSGRCIAILANGKRCPNAAVPGSRFCGIPAHRELAAREAAGEELEASQVVGGVSDEPEEVEEAPAEDAPIEAEVAATALPENKEEVIAEAEPEAEEPPEAPAEAEVPVAVEETVAEGDQPSSA
jgi:N utilization substance protein A